MAVNERTRHDLYEAARRTLGDTPAETLMEMLPPVGWADVATKQDLLAHETATRKDLERLETVLRFEFQATMHKEINRLVFWLIPFFMTYGIALVSLS